MVKIWHRDWPMSGCFCYTAKGKVLGKIKYGIAIGNEQTLKHVPAWGQVVVRPYSRQD